MFVGFYPLSIFLMAYLAGRLNRDHVGNTQSGYLSLISLTGTSRSAWVTVNLIQLWTGFLSVWIVRIPFLYLFFTFGDISFYEILALELLLLFAFAAISARGLLVALLADNRKSVDWSGLGSLILIELMLASGQILIALCALIGVSLPAWLRQLSDIFAGMSLNQRNVSLATGASVTAKIIMSLALFTTLFVYWTMRYHQNLFKRIGETPQSALEISQPKKKQLERRAPLPRCWQDALAWQSFVYYSGGYDNTTGRSILYALGGVCVIFSVATGMFQNLMGLIVVVSLAIFFNLLNAAAHCFEKEMKAETLESLLLTPNDPIDFYHGWRRGALWLSIPDHLYLLVVSVTSYFLDPAIPLVIIGIALAVHASGPLFMLSQLVPISLKGLGTAFVVLAGLAVVGVSGSLVVYSLHPVAFPIVAIPLLWAFNQFLLHVYVGYWMRIKIDTKH